MDYMNDFSKLFHDEYILKSMMLPYRSALKNMVARLETLDDEMKCNFSHSPIHSITSRIKSPESIIDKLHRKGLSIDEDGLSQLYDIGGIRVICKYIEDIYYIRKLLLQYRDVVLIKENDYFKNPKANGYRSLHIIVSIPVQLESTFIQVPLEIQIRTIGMDMWASLEHQLKYKNTQVVSDEVLKELKECADTINQTDEKMLGIYKKLKSL